VGVNWREGCVASPITGGRGERCRGGTVPGSEEASLVMQGWCRGGQTVAAPNSLIRTQRDSVASIAVEQSLFPPSMLPPSSPRERRVPIASAGRIAFANLVATTESLLNRIHWPRGRGLAGCIRLLATGRPLGTAVDGG
jgi:hypothetical protein